MRWLLLLPLFFVIEVALLILSWSTLGFWTTFVLLALSAVAGVLLVRWEGLRVWRSYRQALLEGRMPEEGILSGLLILLGGALLLLPGFLSDLAGILLLVPATRQRVATRLRWYLESRLAKLGAVRIATQGAEFFSQNIDFGASEPRDSEREVIDTEGVVVQSERLLGVAADSTLGESSSAPESARRRSD